VGKGSRYVGGDDWGLRRRERCELGPLEDDGIFAAATDWGGVTLSPHQAGKGATSAKMSENQTFLVKWSISA
jgi:hypothetical protein